MAIPRRPALVLKENGGVDPGERGGEGGARRSGGCRASVWM